MAALGRAGEPETRIVVYFSVGGVIVGAASTLATGGPSVRTGRGVALLLAGSALATVAQLTMTRAYTIGRAPVNASLQYLGIGFSFIYGVLMFNDPVATAALVGMASIVAAGTAATPLRNALQPRDALPSTLET